MGKGKEGGGEVAGLTTFRSVVPTLWLAVDCVKHPISRICDQIPR
jgi:hypothetical protein